MLQAPNDDFDFILYFQGFQEICERGLITGHKLAGIRFILEDGTFLNPLNPTIKL